MTYRCIWFRETNAHITRLCLFLSTACIIFSIVIDYNCFNIL